MAPSYAPSGTHQSQHSLNSRQAFHRPRTSVGSAGHWIKTIGILSPLIIHEMIKDPDQKWRWIRIASVATALLSQATWAGRIRRERRERQSEDIRDMAL
jgi:hypothetical protein